MIARPEFEPGNETAARRPFSGPLGFSAKCRRDRTVAIRTDGRFFNLPAACRSATSQYQQSHSTGHLHTLYWAEPHPHRVSNRGRLAGESPMGDVTRILEAIDDGDLSAAEELLPVVYDELRRLAAQKLSHEKPGHTLQATALVHEAYLRLVGSRDQQWDGRAHFFAAAAEAMRRILVENARRKQRNERSRERRRLDFDEVELGAEPRADILALHDALEDLSVEHSVHADLVKLRYFAGLTIPEAAATLGISHATAERYWAFARAWLHQQLTTGSPRS